ncbi:MAG TPA: phosphoglycerate mutase family protein [Candidatus Saccharimonadales bacterium]|nr:phosphoglycerate mutase family protein [Candidatus Saccharimonadales bacterium]
MSKLVARHGLSEANNYENYGTPAFGNTEAPLMPKGREQSSELGGLLAVRFGIDVATEPVAVTMMRRTQETAIIAGFRRLSIYPELNEEKGGLSDEQVREALAARRPPEATINAAKSIIEKPPIEKIWITHAFLIAAICQELGVYTDESERFTPRFCEVRELPL